MNLDTYEEATELAWMANAYLDSTRRLCASILEEEHERSVHHNRVLLHLSFLSLELYFKAGICTVNSKYPTHHRLEELRRAYDAAMPDLPIPIPVFIERLMPTTADLFEEHPAPNTAIHFQRFRYVSDRKGVIFPELELADVEELKKELDQIHYSAGKVLHRILLSKPEIGKGT